jgi:hypothetical protein
MRLHLFPSKRQVSIKVKLLVQAIILFIFLLIEMVGNPLLAKRFCQPENPPGQGQKKEPKKPAKVFYGAKFWYQSTARAALFWERTGGKGLEQFEAR